MKHMYLTLILLLSGITLNGSTILDTYTQLQKNPRYRKMSLLEIAIDRGEFEAIRYFEFRANPDELRKGRVLLQNKIATFDAIIKEKREDYFEPNTEKVPSLIKVEDARQLKSEYESLLREFIRKIESIDQAQAAREAAIKAASTPIA